MLKFFISSALIFQSVLFFCSSPAFALDETGRLEFWDLIKGMPQTAELSLKTGFSKESIPWWVGIIGSTAVLVNNDEAILNKIQADGRNWGIGNEDHTHPVAKLGDIDLIRLPTDTGSYLYFLGDGWTHFAIAGSFIYYGHSNLDNRAFNTGMRIIHGMGVSTVFNQILKRSFGRESPYVRSEPGGAWKPYPSIPAYQANTPKYDAMPSGHIMTATLTFTIINSSYPEYSNYIIPVECVWLTALGWQMVNNGVHWAADYPLGIAMGYVVGKAAMNLGAPQSAEEEKKAWNWMMLPMHDPDTLADGVTFVTRF